MVMPVGQDYGYRKRVDLSYDEAVDRVQQTLKDQGFGVLCEIDVTATLKAKLDVDFGKRYVILGACNPRLAYGALQAETELGLLLPCNIIVYEDGDGTVVSAIDPEMALGIVGNEQLKDIAKQAGELLKKAVDQV